MQRSFYHLRRALTINPDETLAMQGLAAVVYPVTGRSTVAYPISERLMKIDPLDFITIWIQGGLYFYEGRYDKALKGWKRLYEMYPDNPFSRFYYALILTYQDRIERAFDIIDHNKESYPSHVVAKMGIMLKYAYKNEKQKVFHECTEDFQKTCQRDATYSHHLAGIFAMIYENDEALNWLENAINRGFFNYPLLAERDPFLENIRGEEHFKKLMEHVKYKWEHFEV